MIDPGNVYNTIEARICDCTDLQDGDFSPRVKETGNLVQKVLHSNFALTLFAADYRVFAQALSARIEEMFAPNTSASIMISLCNRYYNLSTPLVGPPPF